MVGFTVITAAVITATIVTSTIIAVAVIAPSGITFWNHFDADVRAVIPRLELVIVELTDHLFTVCPARELDNSIRLVTVANHLREGYTYTRT